MKLRTRLFQLVAGTVVPLVLLAVVLGALIATEQRETYRDGALARIRALTTAIDAELLGHIRAAEALGASLSLEENDLRSFYSDAARVMRSQPDWHNVMLALPNGDQVINLAEPFGVRPDTAADLQSLRQVIETGQPAVGNVYFGESTQAYGIPVRVPVFDAEARLEYVLTAVVDPGAFGELIREQDFPPSWVSGLIDATGHFIGRLPALSPEAIASDDFRSAVRGSKEGWYRGLTVERVDTYTAFRVSDISQWSMGTAIPASVVNAGARNAVWIIVLGTLLSIAIALGFAFIQGRRIALPISQLAASARALGTGRLTDLPPNPAAKAGIAEVREVAKALDETARVIMERHSLLEREQAALRDADRAKDEFLAMLGHELRNPLGAITTAAQVLRVSEPRSDTAAHSQTIIERQTRQMMRLIDDLLDVSSVTMGKLELKRERFDLSRLVKRVLRTWQGSDRAWNGRIALTAEEVWVDADRARMEQVVANLLENASKFSAADSPIEVKVGRDGGCALLEVIDKGEGIAPDMLEHVRRDGRRPRAGQASRRDARRFGRSRERRAGAGCDLLGTGARSRFRFAGRCRGRPVRALYRSAAPAHTGHGRQR
jgi:signal transduction histidine kinase